MPRAAATLALLVALLGAASAQNVSYPTLLPWNPTTTTSTRWLGYSYAGNVIGYVNMTADWCDIMAALMVGDFDTGLDIYENGKNSYSGAAKRTHYRFASHVPSAPEASWDMITMGRDPLWLDTLIRDAFNSSNGNLALGLLHVAQMKYMLHEVDEALSKVSGYAANTTLTSLISDASGAPHNIDEAWALWAGGSPTQCSTLWGVVAGLGDELAATFNGKAYVNMGMTLAVNELLAASRAGDPAKYADIRLDVYRYLTIGGLQGVLHSVYKLVNAVRCKRPDAQAAAAAGIVSHWTYLQPLLKGRGTPAKDIAALAQVLKAPKPAYADTQAVVRRILIGMGLRTDEVGTPTFERVTAGWYCKKN